LIPGISRPRPALMESDTKWIPNQSLITVAPIFHSFIDTPWIKNGFSEQWRPFTLFYLEVCQANDGAYVRKSYTVI
jgi:hypothetical protein